MIKRFLHDESGATMVEYAVLTMIITVTMIAAFGMIGDDLSRMIGSAIAGFN